MAKSTREKPLTVEEMDSFTFFNSYLEKIEKVKDERLQLWLFKSLCRFGCRNEQPDYSQDDSGFLALVMEVLMPQVTKSKETYVSKSNAGAHSKNNNPDGENQHTKSDELMSVQEALNYVVYFMDDYFKDSKLQQRLAEKLGWDKAYKELDYLVLELCRDWAFNACLGEDYEKLLTPQKIYTKKHLINAVPKLMERLMAHQVPGNRYADTEGLQDIALRHLEKREPRAVVNDIQWCYKQVQKYLNQSTQEG